MPHGTITTIVIGASSLMREGLARILTAAGFPVVVSTSTIYELDARSLAQHRFDLLIIDAGDGSGGVIDQIRLFKVQHPAGRVAVIAHDNQLFDIVTAFRAGANVHFSEVVTSDAFIKALELVMLGHTILPSELLPCINNSNSENKKETPLAVLDHPKARDGSRSGGIDDVPRLSEREKCVLRFLVEGASNKIIGRNIEVAEATVKVHVKAILRKIRARNRTQAAMWAMSNGSLIWPPDNPTASLTPPFSGDETQFLLSASADAPHSAYAAKR